MADTTSQSQAKSHFFEGANRIVVIGAPVGVLAIIVLYERVATLVAPLRINYLEIYNYVFNLFAIEFGALIALFALFVCRPTPFLERMRNTQAFAAIIFNVKTAIVLSAVCIFASMILALLRIEPTIVRSPESIAFVVWAAFALAVSVIYARTVRLIFTSLT